MNNHILNQVHLSLSLLSLSLSLSLSLFLFTNNSRVICPFIEPSSFRCSTGLGKIHPKFPYLNQQCPRFFGSGFYSIRGPKGREPLFLTGYRYAFCTLDPVFKTHKQLIARRRTRTSTGLGHQIYSIFFPDRLCGRTFVKKEIL